MFKKLAGLDFRVASLEGILIRIETIEMYSKYTEAQFQYNKKKNQKSSSVSCIQLFQNLRNII